MHFNRPKPVAWFFFILAFGFCFAAGSWQVERLQWKRGLIEQLAEAHKQPPHAGLPKDDKELAALQFRPVTIKGSWLGDTEFHIAPRYLHNEFGYAVIAPFKLSDGRIVLINRGWVPRLKKLVETRPETKVHGNATLTGLVRTDADRTYFTPINQPEKNIWFGRDIAQMAAFAKLTNVVPVIVDLVDPAVFAQKQDSKPSSALVPAKTLPVPSDGVIRPRNDHLSYIITWYGIALGVLVIFITYHRRKPVKV